MENETKNKMKLFVGYLEMHPELLEGDRWFNIVKYLGMSDHEILSSGFPLPDWVQTVDKLAETLLENYQRNLPDTDDPYEVIPLVRLRDYGTEIEIEEDMPALNRLIEQLEKSDLICASSLLYDDSLFIQFSDQIFSQNERKGEPELG